MVHICEQVHHFGFKCLLVRNLSDGATCSGIVGQRQAGRAHVLMVARLIVKVIHGAGGAGLGVLGGKCNIRSGSGQGGSGISPLWFSRELWPGPQHFARFIVVFLAWNLSLL